MKWLRILSLLTICGAEIIVSKNGGSYNPFLRQVGFCKLQSFDTISRSSSYGPSLLTDGRVKMGVGLSNVQFNNSISACGRCIEIITINNFYESNYELTSWDYKKKINGKFIVMVMDQCTDPICESGFLDFDIYSDPPVAFGNPTLLTWQFIQCPIDKDVRELLICFGYSTCRNNDVEGRTIKELFNNAIKQNSFQVYPRNFENSIINLSVQGQFLEDIQSWRWTSPIVSLINNTTWTVMWELLDGQKGKSIIDWTLYFDQKSSNGYRGGFIVSL